ncbi:hypothetical protein [Candidatus Aalborgicola defluviihabitans]|uniref:hypothetical protein n=1 Tax=Candidatus Aalborgicola defluviihabitans TaxID=3386187 RepID=UPI0039B99061
MDVELRVAPFLLQAAWKTWSYGFWPHEPFRWRKAGAYSAQQGAAGGYGQQTLRSVYVCGPTGTGKTTTCIPFSSFSTPDTKIRTVPEDPVNHPEVATGSGQQKAGIDFTHHRVPSCGRTPTSSRWSGSRDKSNCPWASRHR